MLFALIISTKHDLYIGGRLSQKVFLLNLLHQVYSIHCFHSPLITPSSAKLTFTNFLNGWTRLWRSWCNLQDCSHASSPLSTWLYWHGCQLHLRDGSGERRSFRRTRGHPQRGMHLPVVANVLCLQPSRLVLQSSTALSPTSSTLTTSSHISSTLAWMA